MQAGSAANADADSWFGGPRAVLEVVLVAAVALAVRLVDLGYPPFIDELHHLLAAESLLETGTLTIHDGVGYARARLFTYLVAGFFAVFGQSLEVARLPAVLSGVLLVCLVFVWLRAEAGRIAAWTGGLLLCFAPISLYLSQQVRFYSLHALAFWVGTFGVYRLLAREDPPARRVWIGLVCLAAFLFALNLQITTVIGLAGVLLFALLVTSPRAFDAVRRSRHRWLIVGATAAAVGVLVTAAAFLGVFGFILDRALRVDFWGLERADNLRFYHWLLNDEYSFLWTLFPVAVLLALANRWKAGLLFTVVFGVAFLGHSIAAWKAERFLFYALPALFAIWGLAAQETMPWLWRRLEDRSSRSPRLRRYRS
jgi:4-amino-4-deoxy-L-arabinose transferase-like glycosyltransferase